MTSLMADHLGSTTQRLVGHHLQRGIPYSSPGTGSRYTRSARILSTHLVEAARIVSDKATLFLGHISEDNRTTGKAAESMQSAAQGLLPSAALCLLTLHTKDTGRSCSGCLIRTITKISEIAKDKFVCSFWLQGLLPYIVKLYSITADFLGEC